MMSMRSNGADVATLLCSAEPRPSFQTHGLHARGKQRGLHHFTATLDRCAARSRSITVRQPLLRSARCFIMQAVILEMLGISELQSRNASPVHICCASALKAKLALEDNAEKETANASTKPAWRIVLVREAVIFGSSVGRGLRRVVDLH